MAAGWQAPTKNYAIKVRFGQKHGKAQYYAMNAWLVKQTLSIVLAFTLAGLSGCGRDETGGANAGTGQGKTDLAFANSLGTISPADILHPDDSLIGVTKIAVVVVNEGEDKISESTFEDDMEAQLKDSGMEVVRAGTSPKFPLLSLTVNMKTWGSFFQPSVLYSLQLSFGRLFPNPVPGRAEKYSMGLEWTTDYVGTVPVAQLGTIRASARQLTSNFLNTLSDANSKTGTKHKGWSRTSSK
jgi:hypothetical protein